MKSIYIYLYKWILQIRVILDLNSQLVKIFPWMLRQLISSNSMYKNDILINDCFELTKPTGQKKAN